MFWAISYFENARFFTNITSHYISALFCWYLCGLCAHVYFFRITASNTDPALPLPSSSQSLGSSRWTQVGLPIVAIVVPSLLILASAVCGYRYFVMRKKRNREDSQEKGVITGLSSLKGNLPLSKIIEMSMSSGRGGRCSPVPTSHLCFGNFTTYYECNFLVLCTRFFEK